MAKAFENPGPPAFDAAAAIATIDDSGRSLSYLDLERLGAMLLADIGDSRALIAIEAVNTSAFVAVYLAAMRSEHVVLLLPRGEARPDSRICAAFQPNWFISAHPDGCCVAQGAVSRSDDLNAELKLLLPTSGSTGSPKLVKLSAANVSANARSIAQYLALTQRDVAITTLPLSYSYGLSVLNSHLLVGARIALTEASVSTDAFWSFFAQVGASSFAGVPHTYDMLEKRGFLDEFHPSLRYFTQAGGRLPPERVMRFAKYAQEHACRFFVMYGQTEATARIAYMPPEDLSRYPDFIGRPIPGGALQLKGAAEPGAIGELVYSGPNVMMGYAQQRADLLSGSGIGELATGDLAVQDVATGYFKIVGRSSRFIKPFGLRISLDDVEARLAAAGIAAIATGDDSLLVVATQQQVSARASAGLAADLKIPIAALAFIYLPEPPRLDNGKVDYASIIRLGRHARENQPACQPLHQQVASAMGTRLVATPQDSFTSLAGDSLTYVQVMLLLEQRIGQLPRSWPTMAFAELEQLAPRTKGLFDAVEIDVFLRALAIMLVVIHHVTAWHMGGAAMALILVAGYNFSRFQVPQLTRGLIRETLATSLGRIIPVYFLVLTLFFTAMGSFDLSHYLFVSNFNLAYVGPDGNTRLDTFWFVEFFVFTLVAVSCVFLSPRIRNAAAANPWQVPLRLLTFFLACRIAQTLWPDPLVPYSKTTFLLGYVFIIGWLVHLAKSATHPVKAAAVGSGLAVLALLPPENGWEDWPVHLGAFLALSLCDRVSVPARLRHIIATTAAASFYIYMTHGMVMFIFRATFGRALPEWALAPAVIACVVTGMLAWRASVWMASSGIAERVLRRPKYST
ncbi:MAG: hypothetical protein RLZZ227_2133 [Pseudomonadota bacterium]